MRIHSHCSNLLLSILTLFVVADARQVAAQDDFFTGGSSDSSGEESSPDADVAPEEDPAVAQARGQIQQLVRQAESLATSGRTREAIDILYQAGDLVRDVVQQARVAVPEGFDVFVLRARLHLRRDEITEASDAVQNAGQFAQSGEPAAQRVAQVNDLLGQVYEKRGEDSALDARDAYRQAVQGDRTNATYRIHLGKSLVRFAEQQRSAGFDDGAAELSEAVTVFDGVIELAPDNDEAYYRRGKVFGMQFRMKDSLEDLAKAVQLNGNNTNYLARYGQALLSRGSGRAGDPDGKTEEIVQDYRDAIALFERFIAIELPAYQARRNDMAAIRKYEKDDEVEFRLPDVMLLRSEARLALAHELRGEAANDIFRQVIAESAEVRGLDEEDISLRYRTAYHTGIARRMLGDLRGAVDAFNQALRVADRAPRTLGRSQSEAMLRRGIAQYRLGDVDLAMHDFAAVARLGDPRAHFWTGLVYADRGDYSEAVDAYSAAIRSVPDYVVAFQNRGLAYFHLGLYRRAADDFQQLLARDPDNDRARTQRDLALAQLRHTTP